MTISRRFLVCTSGIFICYFVYGILQEKITRSPYGTGENAERFTYMFSLVFSQCLVSYLSAKVILMTPMWRHTEDTTKTIYYVVSSLAYMLAMVSSNMSLQFVSYPKQVIGKSAKPIPVMIMGVLLANKSYPLKKYLFVLLIVTGLFFFMYKDSSGKSVNQDSVFGFGEMLILLSLTMDGLVTSCQERMKSEHKTKSVAMMMNMNFWSSMFSVTVIVLSGELHAFICFLQRYPNCLWLILLYSLCSSLGQYFIYMTVAEFGPLPCVIVTTTRKFFTMFASVLLFGNTLSLRQWIAGIIVFIGLFLDVFYGRSPPKKETAQ